jgi:hypothetical protein
MKKELRKCCLCNRPIKIGYGNNAAPLKEGICCNNCNIKVIQFRINLLKEDLSNEAM